MDLQRMQEALRRRGIGGWLLCDFHNRDVIAYRVLGMDPQKFTSRRWFYFVPANGEPVRLVSKVEPARLDELPGQKRFYRSWRDLHDGLRSLVANAGSVAMNYSPMNNIPYVSIVDAGTVELVRSLGAQIVSSADLVQEFEAPVDAKGLETHTQAGGRIQRIKDEAFALIGERVRAGARLTEHEVQQFILKRFEEEGLDCRGELPIVGVNDHPANPHFEPTAENTYPIRRGDMVLIDLWAKLRVPRAIFYDITWCGFVGKSPPAKYVEIFDVACRARDACLEFIRGRLSGGKPCYGWEADDACRRVVEQAGYGDFFVHRTGHSIGEEVHGNGANLDNLETKDERRLEPGSCFSIEPGIYLDGEMAVRTEINGYVTDRREVAVVGEVQRKLVLIDA